MPKVTTAYRFDSAGYYIGTDPVLEGMLPDDDTMTAPKLKDGHWARWNGESWEYERKPATAEELEGISVAHDDTSAHAEEVRELMRSLASDEEEPGALCLRKDPGTGALTVVRVPELTAAEDLERRIAAVRAERDRRLAMDVDRINAVRWAAMDEGTRAAWIDYRQALLDVPQRTGFPWDGEADWPERPE